MMRTRHVQSAPEVLVIITHSRITARAASALGVGECRAAHRLHSHLQAYSGVGRQTHAAGRQAELPSGREDPPVLDFIPRGPWWGWERPRRMQEACACGAVHQGAAHHMGMQAWPVKTRDSASRSLPCVSEFSAFQFSSTPRGHLGRNSFPQTPLAESGWGGKRDGGAPRGPSLGPERGPS